MQERRSHTRKPVNTRVTIYHPTFIKLEGQTRDISDGGVFVLLDEVPDLNVDEVIKMVMMDSPDVDLIFNMTLLRTEKTGLALQFLDYEKDGVRHSLGELRRKWNHSI